MQTLVSAWVLRVRRAAPYWAALLTLLAVFAMHGPSSDHVMSMPAAMPVAGQAHAEAGHQVTADGPTVGKPASDVSVLVGAAETMHHGDCVGTLRHDTTMAPPAEAVTVSEHQRLVPVLDARLVAKLRGPPPPSLERLCISRT